ncbi:hypothetical protein FIBSPDRAFT_933778 [Athelia psychrophila]|uniref:Uncharacterized protein n=1 Tax=Athelia psychrophila TaxID=1759441 RepID=A0A166GHS4_9AGAM|nr:hypothetical protein FIBSPDRAFT_933778 [Fibularhizoctonia sp. CBS 109695]
MRDRCHQALAKLAPGSFLLNKYYKEIEPAMELPSLANASCNSPSLMDSDEDMSLDSDDPGSSDDDAMEEIAMCDEPAPSSNLTSSPLPQPPTLVHSSPNTAVPSRPPTLRPTVLLKAATGAQSGERPRPTASLRSLDIGERLKQRFLDIDVLATLVGLFFELPWTNFMHSGRTPHASGGQSGSDHGKSELGPGETLRIALDGTLFGVWFPGDTQKWLVCSASIIKWVRALFQVNTAMKAAVAIRTINSSNLTVTSAHSLLSIVRQLGYESGVRAPISHSSNVHAD